MCAAIFEKRTYARAQTYLHAKMWCGMVREQRGREKEKQRVKMIIVVAPVQVRRAGKGERERVTGHVTESTRSSRDRPRDVRRTCLIAWYCLASTILSLSASPLSPDPSNILHSVVSLPCGQYRLEFSLYPPPHPNNLTCSLLK